MAAVNDITGKVIKTSPQNSAYSEGWERIYAKKNAHEWAAKEGIEIVDYDGWRLNDGVTLDTPTTYSDFNKRLSYSNINID
jgi:hypothetical protein